jgi:hypothetical protein
MQFLSSRYSGFRHIFNFEAQLMNPDISNQETLEKAIKIAAKVSVNFGKIYLPVFNRLYEELEKMKGCRNEETLALMLAKSYADPE